MPRLLTSRELAEALRCSTREAQRIARWVPHYRVGRGLRFDLAEVLAALRQDTRNGSDPQQVAPADSVTNRYGTG